MSVIGGLGQAITKHPAVARSVLAAAAGGMGALYLSKDGTGNDIIAGGALAGAAALGGAALLSRGAAPRAGAHLLEKLGQTSIIGGSVVGASYAAGHSDAERAAQIGRR